MAPVETERLRLRPVELTDAPRLVELLTPGASRWLISWPPDYATEAMEVRIRKAQAAMLEGRSFFFVVEQKTEPSALGTVAVTQLKDDPGRGELGY